MINNIERVEFLKKIHLFYGVADDLLASITPLMNEVEYKKESVIYKQGSSPEALFIVYSGRVQARRQKKEKQEILTNLTEGDYYGQEELLNGRPRLASLVADTDAVLFRMPLALIKSLLKKIPRLKYTIDVDSRSQRLARLLRFDWLGKDEEIFFLARRHWAILVQWLVTPVLALAGASFLLAWGLLTQASFPAYAGFILIWLVLGWVLWRILDWTNDYYIVTNQRVVWLEKVIGLYDSRQEAPLSTLLSVGVETDLIGRMLDYGSLVVRTFVGRIEFSHVSFPYEAAHLVSEYWERTKTASSHAEKEAMTNVLRERLGQSVPVQPQEMPKPAELDSSRRSVILALTRLLGGNLFKIRLEDSGIITYRKHWFVLLKQIWQPSFFFLILFIWTLSRAYSLLSSGSMLEPTLDGRLLPDTLLVAQGFVLFVLSLWWIYQLWDWHNDIFQVTPDQILDIDKKPFGTEEKRAAPLDNILSTQYSRIGLAGYIFNFGTVYITVGGSQLAFEDVSDPASVQADIDRRRVTSLARNKESEARRERERMADWLAAYHENMDNLENDPHYFGDEKKIE